MNYTEDLLNLDGVRIDPVWALKVPPTLAMRRQILPFALLDGKLHVACADTGDAMALEAVERFTGQSAVATPVDRESLERALRRVYAEGSPAGRGAGDTGADDPVVVSSRLLHAASLCQASDIHIEPCRDFLRIRFRVDGVLEEYQRLSSAVEAGLVSRFKVLAGMDIAEKRAPQDGSFTHSNGADSIDIRAATLPTKHGEKMTLRLLGRGGVPMTLEMLGMSERDLVRMHAVLDRPHGLVLLTGPTGSGKTTTLYAAIQRLLSMAALNIITIEDPIEREIAGVSQVEVDSADKVSFSKALRSVLRHDPDVVMIGEIRDADTLDIAVKAALTGHLVLSSLHTNSAASAMTRLLDMGLAPYLASATLRMSVAQRLVRRLCPRCSKPRKLTIEEATALRRPDAAGAEVREPGGCLACAGHGYIGRMGLFEMYEPIEGDVERGEGAVQSSLRERGVALLMDDAADKVLAGMTTLKEVLHVAGD